jgi:glycerate kinase
MKVRLKNYHLPGHSEIITYALHNANIIHKNDVRDTFSVSNMKGTIDEVFKNLKHNLTQFVPIRFSPVT